ncbi:nucleotide sugar dehydrogenase [Streptococcus mitis]|uniref:nucleotide sugar dehydrogenase n=1 Tax=Streptococcus mitis TaxID=28037 RepID=UPI0019342E2B|nr:nucleotide sugar dehydrogenase [Streptococcus mitis]
MNIAVIGLGYVGLANALLFASKYKVVAYDIDTKKISNLERGIVSFNDDVIATFIAQNKLDISFTSLFGDIENNIDYYIIALPTNYDTKNNGFNISQIEQIISKILMVNEDSKIILKSTIPIGFSNKLKKQFYTENIFFVPEFLREGYSLYDSLYPNRIVIGDKSSKGEDIANLFLSVIAKKDVEVMLVNSDEAEAIKLFSNAYLALRVAFFNELDSFTEFKNLCSRDIIKGVCLDSRIGDYYNTPSFGFGGYCLPKDTKQLENEFKGCSAPLIKAITISNTHRKKYVVSQILARTPSIVGIYKLGMKRNSDNYREAAILKIIRDLLAEGIRILIYDPVLRIDLEGVEFETNFNLFIERSDLIVANRWDEKLIPYKNKIYTRDLLRMD